MKIYLALNDLQCLICYKNDISAIIGYLMPNPNQTLLKTIDRKILFCRFLYLISFFFYWICSLNEL